MKTDRQKLLEDATLNKVATYWGWSPEKLLDFVGSLIAEKDYYTLWALGAFPAINALLVEALAKLPE